MAPFILWNLPANSATSDKIAQDKPLILVVDDNSDVTCVFAAVLERAGYDVTSATSGQVALQEAHRKHFDVIVSDISMPEMDGYELARALRELPDYGSTPLVAVTGFEDQATHQNAFAAGFNAYLRKPIDPPKLLEILARLGH
jgi:CheY-like chemotaxis protein